MPPGWNVGYWDNRLEASRRIAVLEGTRLSALRHEAFQGRGGGHGGILTSVLCHGSVAALDMSGRPETHVGDVVTCCTTMWFSYLTRDFERTADGGCVMCREEIHLFELSAMFGFACTSADRPAAPGE
jgi:hypothetical protein